MPIKIDFLANVSNLLRGTKNVDDALDDVADSLDDVARDGDDSTEKLERSFKDLADAARDESKRADKELRKIGDNDGGISRAGKATGDFKDEAVANFSEVTSSFNGDMTSIGDLAQGTFGGLASTLTGPLGLAAGAAAVGVGLIASAIGDVETRRKELEERANDLAQAYIEAGGRSIDALTLASRTSEILTDPEQRKEAERLRDLLGIDLPTAVRAMAGDTIALAAANSIVNGTEKERADLMRDSADYLSGEYTTAEKDRLAQLLDAKSAVDELNGVAEQANETYQTQTDILTDLTAAAVGATEKTDAFGNRLVTLPNGVQVVIDAETGKATTDLSAFKGDLDAVAKPIVIPLALDTSWAREQARQIREDLASRGVVIPVTTALNSGRGWE